MKKIYKYKEFKLLLERDDDFDFGDESENQDENQENQDDFDKSEEESKSKVFNEDPGYYAEQALKKIENKIISLFEEPKSDENGRTEEDPSSYHSQGVELIDVKTTDMPMKKTLIIKYHDDQFVYHLMITIDIDEGIPDKPDIEMDFSMIDECGVKFKKYDLYSNLLGQLDRKKVQIDTIDQDFIDTLNSELDNKYSIKDDFEIEYKEEGDD